MPDDNDLIYMTLVAALSVLILGVVLMCNTEKVNALVEGNGWVQNDNSK